MLFWCKIILFLDGPILGKGSEFPASPPTRFLGRKMATYYSHVVSRGPQVWHSRGPHFWAIFRSFVTGNAQKSDQIEISRFWKKFYDFPSGPPTLFRGPKMAICCLRVPSSRPSSWPLPRHSFLGYFPAICYGQMPEKVAKVKQPDFEKTNEVLVWNNPIFLAFFGKCSR